MESELSPRHLRRRSMPASFNNFKHPTSANGDASATTRLDKLSISNIWDKYESKLNSSKLKLKLIREDEKEWKRNLGMDGNAFWGYSSDLAESAFFASRIKLRTSGLKAYLLSLCVVFIGEIFCDYKKMFTHWLSTIGLLLTLIVLAVVVKNVSVLTEKLLFGFFMALVFVEGLQNPAYQYYYSPSRYVADEMFSPISATGYWRKWMLLFLTYLIIGCTIVVGFKPFLSAVVAFSLVVVAHFPTYLQVVPAVSSVADFEVFITIVGPVNYMLIGCILVGTLYHSFERRAFEQSILSFDLEQHVESVRKASTSSQLPRVGSGSRFSGSFNNNLSTGSIDSLSSLVQDSTMDRRMKALQQIREEFSVKSHPVVQVLIDICVSAMAMNMKQTESNPNWTEFFISEQEQNSPSNPARTRSAKSNIGQQQPSSPQRSSSKLLARNTDMRRRRRHSIVHAGPNLEIPSYSATPDVHKVVPRRRSSSADLIQIGSPGPILHASKEGEDDHTLSPTHNLESLMKDWSFGTRCGIWTSLFSDVTRAPLYSHPLRTVTMRALTSLGLLDSHELNLTSQVCLDYLTAVEQAYLPRKQVPYHNALHACDVVQTVFAMLTIDMVNLSDLALFAIVCSAAVHDVAHPGLNNTHLISTRSELAITYNDRSVLENFHVSKAFSLMRSDPRYDILGMLKRNSSVENVANTFRSLVIEMVIATDLKHHFDQQARLRILVAAQHSSKSIKGGGDDMEYDDRSDRSLTTDSVRTSGFSPADTTLICSSLLHAADISNVAKKWEAYKPWMDVLFEEFFAQGDLEKSMGMQVEPMMDRDVCDPAGAQTYFITKLVAPLFQILKHVIPVTSEIALVEMDRNVAKLQKLSAERQDKTTKKKE